MLQRLIKCGNQQKIWKLESLKPDDTGYVEKWISELIIYIEYISETYTVLKLVSLKAKSLTKDKNVLES